MADVLIRGIEMPDNTEGCEVIIRIQPNGEVLDAHKIHIGATAIPLPAGYGRLIDADAALKKIPIPTGGVSSVDIYNNIEYFIETRPTIVPAERGDN